MNIFDHKINTYMYVVRVYIVNRHCKFYADIMIFFPVCLQI